MSGDYSLDVIEEELQAQVALLEQENARYAGFFEYAPDACAITGADGLVREANHALAELLGMPREEIVGKRLSDLVAGCELSARPIPLKDGGAGGLCWRIRPA